MALPWNLSLSPECHLQQNVSLYITPYRPCPWVSPPIEYIQVLLWQNMECHAQPNMTLSLHPCPWVSPLTKSVLTLVCHTSREPVSVSWVSSPDRLNLSCLLDQLTTEYVSVSWVPPIEKKKYRLLGVIPCENLPHLLCACHLLAHGPGLGLHAVQFLFLFTDIGFYLPIISSS